MGKPKRLAPLSRGKYTGWIGFADGEPHAFRDPAYYDGVLRCDLFVTKSDARRCYADVRRVTIIVEGDQDA